MYGRIGKIIDDFWNNEDFSDNDIISSRKRDFYRQFEKALPFGKPIVLYVVGTSLKNKTVSLKKYEEYCFPVNKIYELFNLRKDIYKYIFDDISDVVVIEHNNEWFFKNRGIEGQYYKWHVWFTKGTENDQEVIKYYLEHYPELIISI